MADHAAWEARQAEEEEIAKVMITPVHTKNKPASQPNVDQVALGGVGRRNSVVKNASIVQDVVQTHSLSARRIRRMYLRRLLSSWIRGAHELRSEWKPFPKRTARDEFG